MDYSERSNPIFMFLCIVLKIKKEAVLLRLPLLN